MSDSGSTRSFIKQSVIEQLSHLPIRIQHQQYLMADGSTTFDVIGTVKIFIEINHLKTSIVAGVVKSLCVGCILGMDYINKYQVNLINKSKQVQIHGYNRSTIISMEEPTDGITMGCCLTEPIRLYPFQEKIVKIKTQISHGQMLFTPSDDLQRKGLCITHAFISIIKHQAFISIYNSTPNLQHLDTFMVIGTATPLTPSISVSSVFHLQPNGNVDEDQTTSSNSDTERMINTLLMHIEDQQQLEQLQVIIKKHHQLFDTTKATIAETPTPHAICTTDNPPPASRPYPQTMEKRKALLDILQQMLDNQQIRPSYSQYAAPVLLIKKRDGLYRFVVDYRKLNDITIQDRYPLPNIEQTIQMVGGYQYYTKLDLRAGYFQIPIRENDRHKTAFVTCHGLYEFNVLAQGLKNSPPSFQRIMSDLLSPCKQFCLVYLDDILVYSKNFEQHVYHLNQVLAILNKHKFQLNPQKCELCYTTINYLGHIISQDTIKPIQDRIEKILSIPQPRTLNEANAFIGAIGWYRKFIKNYAQIAAPILAVTNLTRKNKHKFKWNMEQSNTFDELKRIIISEPLFLNYPDADAPIILATDASDYCIGGVLYQEINGARKNIYFHSQVLPKSQRKWSTVEKEALAIYYSVMRMKLYLLGRPFIIQTDHCPLRDMHKKPSNNRRVDRISLVLQQYNIQEIRHVSGKCNCMADYLTRYPRQVEDDEEFFEADYGIIPAANSSMVVNYPQINSIGVGAAVTRAQAKVQTEDTYSNSSSSDSEEISVVDDPSHLVVGHDFDISCLAEAQKVDALFQEKMDILTKDSTKCSYVLENGLLKKLIKRGVFTKKLVYVPKSMVNKLLKAYHDVPWAGHFGFHRTYVKIKDKYWWPDMKNIILNYIQACRQCQQFNIDRRKPPGLLNPIEPPDGPFQLIGADYSGPFPATPEGNQYVLAITDYFTKWVIAIPLPNQTATTTAQALYENYICIYGVPKRILTDQGSHFNNQLIQAFTKLLGCHHIKSTPYHPQTNGAIERFNSTFERQIAKLTDTYTNNWDTHVKSIVFAYNTGQHATTKYSPYQLQFGRSPTLPPDKPNEHFEFYKPNDYFRHLQQTIKLYQQQALHNMKNKQQNYKMRYDRNRVDIHYKIGDYVFKKLPGSPSKLSAIYSNPMIVIKQEHPTYWIKDPDTEKIHQTHVSQLKRCTSCDLFLPLEQEN